MIIDVDAHGEPAPNWLEGSQLADRLRQAPANEGAVRFIAGDLLADVAPDRWPTAEEVAPPGLDAILGRRRIDGFSYDGANQRGVVEPEARIAWLDEVGIDRQNTIAVQPIEYARFVADRTLARDLLGACNSWMADMHDGFTDRLWPVTTIDQGDVDWSIAELTKMRARGSRAFLISSAPVDGVPPTHSSMDRLWAAATDLGMVPIIHVGMNPARFDPGWANVEGDMTLLRQLGVSQAHQSIQLFLNAMVFGGVFERHPALTVLIAECGIHWFAGTVEHMQQRDARQAAHAAVNLGPYKWPLSPAEYVARNIRITPVPSVNQNPAALLERHPDCVVFSSDYAHNEGNPSPVRYYQDLLAGTEASTLESFFGKSMADCYARMGDPIPADR
jgi:predicted TIM-barrel fold metal-dependent hydrolase